MVVGQCRKSIFVSWAGEMTMLWKVRSSAQMFLARQYLTAPFIYYYLKLIMLSDSFKMQEIAKIIKSSSR